MMGSIVIGELYVGLLLGYRIIGVERQRPGHLVYALGARVTLGLRRIEIPHLKWVEFIAVNATKAPWQKKGKSNDITTAIMLGVGFV